LIYSFKDKPTPIDEASDMTSPTGLDGSVVTQLVSLTEAVRQQAEIIEAMKGLPQAVESLQQRFQQGAVDSAASEVGDGEQQSHEDDLFEWLLRDPKESDDEMSKRCNPQLSCYMQLS
jgi:outer membrane lipoprotein-sorting protein